MQENTLDLVHGGNIRRDVREKLKKATKLDCLRHLAPNSRREEIILRGIEYYVEKENAGGKE